MIQHEMNINYKYPEYRVYEKDVYLGPYNLQVIFFSSSFLSQVRLVGYMELHSALQYVRYG